LAKLKGTIFILLLHIYYTGNDPDGLMMLRFTWLLLVVGMVHQQNNILPRHIISGPDALLPVDLIPANPTQYKYEINCKKA